MSPGQMMPEQMSPWQMESVLVVPRNLPLIGSVTAEIIQAGNKLIWPVPGVGNLLIIKLVSPAELGLGWAWQKQVGLSRATLEFQV